MRLTNVLAVTAALCVGGCTFGLGDQVSFVTRDLRVTGTLADGALATTEGMVEVVPREVDVTQGVTIFIDADDGDRGVDTQLEFDGNLGALCPGSRVELRGLAGTLTPTSVSGAPAGMVGQLNALSLRAQADTQTTMGSESLIPTSVVVASSPGGDGFAHMTVTATADVDGESRVFTASFDLARVVEPAETPGWEGDTWRGQPIANWD